MKVDTGGLQQGMLGSPLRACVAFAISALLTFGVMAGLPSPASAKACGSVTIANGWTWVVGGGGMSCYKMRKWSRSMILGKGRPKGWRCRKRNSGPLQSGGCSRGPNGTTPFFIYYPPD